MRYTNGPLRMACWVLIVWCVFNLDAVQAFLLGLLAWRPR